MADGGVADIGDGAMAFFTGDNWRGEAPPHNDHLADTIRGGPDQGCELVGEYGGERGEIAGKVALDARQLPGGVLGFGVGVEIAHSRLMGSYGSGRRPI